MLWGDIETFSLVPITYGTSAYAKAAELLLFAYGKDDGPIKIWDKTAEPMPEDLNEYIESDEPWCAHNSAFESAILSPMFGIDYKRWRCSMAKCYAHALPGGLEQAGIVLGLPLEKQKIKEGRALMLFFCTPKGKKKEQRNTRLTHPEKWEKFKEYCINDVEAMREIWKRSPSWNYPNRELEFWQLDQKINRRGIAVDMELVRAAIKIADSEKRRLSDKTYELTDGAVKAATQRDQMLNFIAETYCITMEDMQGATVEKLLENADLPTELVELLLTRLQSNRTSTAKYKRILNWQTEERLRYMFQYCGASRTLRFGGRGPQGQNLKRPEPYIAKQWEFAAEVIKSDVVDLFFDDPMDVIASMIRGALVPEAGNKLVVADLAGIEGCVLPWLAGEETELARIRDQQAGIGYDAYVWAYARAHGIDPKDVTKEMRTKGKPISLAFGYGGGVGALVSMAAIYGVDLDDMALQSRSSLPAWAIEEAEGMYEWASKSKAKFEKFVRGLSKETFVVCDALKRVWRKDHPETVKLWDALEENFKLAICNPGETFKYRNLTFRRDGNWLRIQLPSGDFLCYPSPRITEKGAIRFMGVKQFTKRWSELETFGGRLSENVTSGTARGILKHGMIAADKENYEIVLHAHDEIAAEVGDNDNYSVGVLSQLMTTGLYWCDGLPLAAAGYEGPRYKKE